MVVELFRRPLPMVEPFRRPLAMMVEPFWRPLAMVEPFKRPLAMVEPFRRPLAILEAFRRPAAEATCLHTGPKRDKELSHWELRRRCWLRVRRGRDRGWRLGCDPTHPCVGPTFKGHCRKSHQISHLNNVFHVFFKCFEMSYLTQTVCKG